MRQSPRTNVYFTKRGALAEIPSTPNAVADRMRPWSGGGMGGCIRDTIGTTPQLRHRKAVGGYSAETLRRVFLALSLRLA